MFIISDMDEAKILQDLYDFNPFWKEGPPPEGRLFHRQPFASLVNLLKLPQIVTLTGLRRTGKTTLLLQLISYLIEEETVPPARICRYQFEEKLISPKLEDLEAIIRLYIRNIIKEDLHTPNRIFFFFDELQFVEGWQGIIKKYYDLNKNIKFVVSGSASLFIQRATKESLAGRAFDEKVTPLTFKEYLSINRDHQMELWGGDFNLEGDFEVFFNSLKTIYAKNRDIATNLFETFLIRGQFPEIASWQDVSLAFRYIRDSILTKLIEFDLPKLYGFRKTDELALLISVLAKETGNLLEYENLSREIGVAQNTLKDYLQAFQESSLVDLLYNHTRKHRKAKRQLKKGYIASPNLTCALHHLTCENLINNPLLGHLVETEMVNRLKVRYPECAFWNQRGQEVDLIVSWENQLIPIEIKYKNRIQKGEWRPLSRFLEKKEAPFGILFTKNELYRAKEAGKPLYFIPAWLG